MVKKYIRYGAAGATSLVMAAFGFGGIASAASISMTGPGSTNYVSGGHSGSIYLTGPGSTNVIRGGYGSGGSIHTTGPGSTNYVSNGHGYSKYKKDDHKKSEHKVKWTVKND